MGRRLLDERAGNAQPSDERVAVAKVTTSFAGHISRFCFSPFSLERRYCTYPQEIVLKLSSLSKIRNLQLLSHQYLIREYGAAAIWSQILKHKAAISNQT